MTRRRLLCIGFEFPPQATPTAIRTGKLLARLAADWDLDVVTANPDAALPGTALPGLATLRHVPAPPPSRLRRARLPKLAELFELPDDKRAWVAPATAAALAAAADHRPDAAVVFMMPYAAGLVGLALKRAGIPVVMNFDDSPTCDDMHPSFPTPWHAGRAAAFEDRLVRAADAVVYVSQRNLERVRDRQPPGRRAKFHLVRYGADPPPADPPPTDPPPTDPPPAAGEPDVYRIVYVGGLTGWYDFGHRGPEPAARRLARRAVRAWGAAGRRHLVDLDHRGSSPVFVGHAAKQAVAGDATLAVRVEVYGNRYPRAVVDRVLAGEGLAGVVAVHGPVPNARAVELARGADLLFLTLPDRRDGSAGGRISAKTYEYLMTDRPILAALPPGENADFLAAYAGVTVVRPTDVDGMAAAIRAAVAAPRRFARPAADLDYAGRAAAFAAVLDRVAGVGR